jgi:hypothetical protein
MDPIFEELLGNKCSYKSKTPIPNSKIFDSFPSKLSYLENYKVLY